MDSPAQRAIIFAGPSLPPAARPSDRALEWRPPVRQGEVYAAAVTGPAIIGIVDGYFEVTPSVWHKEILWAMSRGIHVYGAASIGALRAAELHNFGMVGVGRIFAMFRDGVLADDDEVAVLHGPEELGYPALTDAMVNIRATLEAARAAAIIDAMLDARLTAIAKSLFYKERSWAAVVRRGAAGGLPAASLAALTAWLGGHTIDQKRADALAMVAQIRRHLAGGVAPLAVDYRFHATGYHHAAARR
jgi:hypothetical protein